MRESSTRFSLSQINLSNWSTFLPHYLSFPSHRSSHSSLITLSRPSLNSCLKLQTDLSIILFLFCVTVSRLIYVTLLITSLLHLSVICQTICRTVLFLLSLYSPRLSQDGYLRCWLLTKLCCFISYLFCYHSPSFHSRQFYFFDL